MDAPLGHCRQPLRQLAALAQVLLFQEGQPVGEVLRRDAVPSHAGPHAEGELVVVALNQRLIVLVHSPSLKLRTLRVQICQVNLQADGSAPHPLVVAIHVLEDAIAELEELIALLELRRHGEGALDVVGLATIHLDGGLGDIVA